MKRFGIMCASLLMAASVSAQPTVTSVTGALTPGGRVTITGSQFGTHGDYGGPQAFLNAAWNDFSVGINGGNLALDGTNNAAWSYETAGGRAPGRRWARHTFNAATSESVRRLGSLSLNLRGTTGTYYSSFYLKCQANSEGKFWRIYGAAADIFISRSAADGHLTGYSTAGSATTVWGTSLGTLPCATRWVRVEIYMRDAPDDLIDVSVDGMPAFRRGSQLPSRHIDVEGSSSNQRERWVASPWGGNGHTLDFGNMVDAGFWGISDAFVDFTRARVELSDSSTWANARRKELQIPLQWATSEVVISPNLGSLVGQVYLYVVDAEGRANAKGFPVTGVGTP